MSGRVVDATTLLALEGARVELDRLGTAAAPYRRVTLTDGNGDYGFAGIGPGVYRITVRQVGYRLSSVEVDLREVSTAALSLGLAVEPLVLPPVRVTGEPPELYGAARGQAGELAGARVEAARLRQARYVAGDARELTQADVVEAVTLAETDIFRALQRTPGVSTRDDYTATMWTRGAPWDQTRVYFDGLPLFNPTHAGWLFSAVNPDALGDVAFLPGVRSARWGEGAAGVVDLRSRSGGRGGSPLEGRGEVSVASARLSAGGRSPGGGLGWMLAARRTYVDLLTGLADVLAGSDTYIPYDFADVVGRVDLRSSKGWGVMASGILERDHLRGDVSGLLRANRGAWGNRSGQLTATLPLGTLQAEVQVGRTRFDAAVLQRKGPLVARPDPSLPPLETGIQHEGFSVRLGPAPDATGDARWSLGYQAARDSVDYDGPISLLGELAVVLGRRGEASSPLQYGNRLGYQAFWGEARFHPLRRLTVESGVRVEAGARVRNGGEYRVGPRLALKWQPDSVTSVSTGWGRSFQYTHDVAPVAGPLGPQLHLTHLWVLAEERGRPVLRSDVLTVGAERWIAPGWLAGATVYRRRATGVVIPNPTDGPVVPDRDPDVAANSDASGVELSVRRLSGRWTGSLGYAYGRSTVDVDAVINGDSVHGRFPGSADIRHSLDATGLVRLRRPVRVGGAFTFGSGVPFTRLVLPDSASASSRVELQGANAQRTPLYASLDLIGDYSRSIGSAEVTAFLQIRNAFNRANRVTYEGSTRCGAAASTLATLAAPAESACSAGAAFSDHFGPGIPRIPLVGLRVTF